MDSLLQLFFGDLCFLGIFLPAQYVAPPQGPCVFWACQFFDLAFHMPWMRCPACTASWGPSGRPQSRLACRLISCGCCQPLLQARGSRSLHSLFQLAILSLPGSKCTRCTLATLLSEPPFELPQLLEFLFVSPGSPPLWGPPCLWSAACGSQRGNFSLYLSLCAPAKVRAHGRQLCWAPLPWERTSARLCPCQPVLFC